LIERTIITIPIRIKRMLKYFFIAMSVQFSFILNLVVLPVIINSDYSAKYETAHSSEDPICYC
jgi:hypothetical protein